jgi:hypothetical protein
VDDKRFDEFVKQVSAGREARRSFVKRAAGGALAGFVALRGGKAGAVPSCRTAGHPCEGNQECCPGLVCRVTGPGNAKRCAAPPKAGKESFGKESFGKESFGKESFGKESFGKESFGKESFGKESFGLERFGPVTGYDLPVLGAAAVSLPDRGIGARRAFIRPDERPSVSDSVIRDGEALSDDGVCLA